MLLGWFLEKPVVELSESVLIASDRTADTTITARGCFKVKCSLVYCEVTTLRILSTGYMRTSQNGGRKQALPQ